MNNKAYENPEIQVISLEPDESLMQGEGGGETILSGQGTEPGNL